LSSGSGEALEVLDQIVRRLRAECPWDREQDERSIVPHTLEEAYELADAAQRRDDAKLLDELGDVLFQVHFLSLLLEERGAGDLAGVARHATEKLVRRHPHVFGEARAETAGEVLRNWDRIKAGEAGREQGVFGEVPENLPSLLYARKVQRRAASSGLAVRRLGEPLQSLVDELSQLGDRGGEMPGAPGEMPGDRGGEVPGAPGEAEARFRALGDVLFAIVDLARELRVDPELALRSASERFRGEVQAALDLAASEGLAWNDLPTEDQLALLTRARSQGAR
jgi:uncharacterized protein YabN with tetrapyrrole methylase and pyrophosphatase domain